MNNENDKLDVPARKCISGSCYPNKVNKAKAIKPFGKIKQAITLTQNEIDNEDKPFTSNTDSFFEIANKITATKKSKIMIDTPYYQWKFEPEFIISVKWYQFWKWPLLIPSFAQVAKDENKRKIIESLQADLKKNKFELIEIQNLFTKSGLEFI